MIFVRYHLPVIIYAGLIFAVSSISKLPDEIPQFDFSDKLLHFFEFMLFGWLLWRSAFRWKIYTYSAKFMIVVLMLGSVYAASDEIHQLFVTGRQGSIYDWIADTIGLAAGLATAYIFIRKKGVVREAAQVTNRGK